MNKLKTIVATLTLTIGCTALAHTGVTGIVKERMDAMKDMSKMSKEISAMFKGKTQLDHNTLATAADAFVMHGTEMKALFPDTHDSRMGKKTEALPKIWEDEAGFNAAIEDFIALSESLQQTVAETTDEKALKKAFQKTAKSCSGCHKQYRKPKR